MKRITLAILTACAVSTGVHAQSNCAGDISGDGQVNGVDLALVLTSWGVCQANPAIGGAAQRSEAVMGAPLRRDLLHAERSNIDALNAAPRLASHVI
jgi:hypothetical protein